VPYTGTLAVLGSLGRGVPLDEGIRLKNRMQGSAIALFYFLTPNRRRGTLERIGGGLSSFSAPWLFAL
jgi:hypothetical protein